MCARTSHSSFARSFGGTWKSPGHDFSHAVSWDTATPARYSSTYVKPPESDSEVASSKSISELLVVARVADVYLLPTF